MAQTGRVSVLAGVDGRGAELRRRARVRGVIGTVVLGIVATSATLMSVAILFALSSDQSAQNAYDKAPYCAADTTDTTSCVLRTTASVGSVDVSKNTGKNAHGYTTKVYLEPATDIGRNQTVELSDSDDLSGSVASGDVIPVLVWQGDITRFTFSGTTHNADKNPHSVVAVDLAGAPVLLIAAMLSGRPVIRRLQPRRVALNLQRNRIPDWTLLALAPVVTMAAILRASDAVVLLGCVGLAVLVGSVGWPFIPWVATIPERQRPLGGKQSSYAAKNRKRTQAKKKLP